MKNPRNPVAPSEATNYSGPLVPATIRFGCFYEDGGGVVDGTSTDIEVTSIGAAIDLALSSVLLDGGDVLVGYDPNTGETVVEITLNNIDFWRQPRVPKLAF
jgi:hypothetical protein